MKKIIFAIIAVVAMFSFESCSYNTMVSEQEAVDSAWSEVENQYQRRLDLIPNLVNVVKGYAAHEQETLTGVIEARSKATSITIDPSKVTADQLKKFNDAQSAVSQSLGRLMAVAEAYPNIKANENFLELQAQLEGTENRITVARKNFNGATKTYNTTIRKFPNVIYSGWFGFEQKPYFSAETGAEKAPKVEF